MNTLISIIGPTAVGKTSLSVELATKYKTEIISSDSRQMYQFMNIGTAKPTMEEQKDIPHHFIDTLTPDQSYNAGEFEREAEVLIIDLFQRYSTLIVVGGSTLYNNALWYGFNEMPQIDPLIREGLNKEMQSLGLESLLDELYTNDPETYERIDRQNPVRGQPISTFRTGPTPKERPYKTIKIGLGDERETLYKRINQRVIDMLDQGLIEEVQGLLDRGYSPTLPALQSIGYQEVISYLQGKYDLDEAIRLIKRNSRRYAKRQLTYFRRYEDIHWFKPDEFPSLHSRLEEEIRS
ncbi:UNVERIFIED_CONTAM: hypothetical protein GTU68_020003 [Idotea baltica]|nr:hypothetical protein [Idotea baltica]